MLAGAHRRIAGLAGWRRSAAALVFGALSVAAFPPFYVLPALPVALVGVLWLLDGGRRDGRQARAAAMLGWWFGLGHFVLGLYWIANAFMVDAERFGWLAPFAVVGLSAYFAIYPGLALLAAAWARPGLARVFVFAGAWTLAEMLRGTALTGFPWNPIGSVLALHPALIQGAALAGIYGLSFLVALAASVPATLMGRNAGAASRRARIWPSLAALVALGLVFAGGWLRLRDAPAAPGPVVRVVQGAIAQEAKWRRDQARDYFGLYLRLSRERPAAAPPGLAAPVAVIWPETAVPIVYDGSPDYARALADAAPPGGILVTGVVRRSRPDQSRAVWNSVLAVDGRGAVVGLYDKHHLVPFGEYVPLARFNPLPKLTEGRVDFSAGPGPTTLALPGLGSVAPLVCYEVIFPAAVVAVDGPRPRLLLNLTNDAWFGRATGPYQHLVAARLRAVEEGLPVVRAANTGISAVIDAHGRVTASLGLGARGAFDAPLPAALPGPTLFARLGNAPFAVVFALILIVGLVRLRP